MPPVDHDARAGFLRGLRRAVSPQGRRVVSPAAARKKMKAALPGLRP